MNTFGRTLLAALLVGGLAALVGFGGAKLLIPGADPERIAPSIMLVLTFLAGTITCGLAAARYDPARRYGTAVLAALAYEVILIVVARPGLNLRTGAVAFAVAAFFATLAAFIGRR